MTISTQTNRNQFAGNGVTTDYNYAFRLDDDAHMEVYLDGIIQSSGYSIVKGGGNIGGVLTFSSVPSVGVTVDLLRNIPLTQDVDYKAYDAFPAETHESALDKATMLSQQVNELISRAVITPINAPVGVSYVLPTPEADKVLVWNATATGFINGPSQSDFQTWVSDAQNAANAAAASEVAAALSATQAAASAIMWDTLGYNDLTPYPANTGMSYLGSSFRSLQETTGNIPTEGAYWTVIAQKGDAGAGTGDMLAANDLSEVNAANARGNLGLGNVDNTNDANKPVSIAQQALFDVKAPLVSPTFTGAPSGPTPIVSNNSTQFATTEFVALYLTANPTTPATLQVLSATSGAAYRDIGSYAGGVSTSSKSAGSTYAGSTIGLSSGTWRCLGQTGFVAPVGFGAAAYYYLFLRIA